MAVVMARLAPAQNEKWLLGKRATLKPRLSPPAGLGTHTHRKACRDLYACRTADGPHGARYTKRKKGRVQSNDFMQTDISGFTGD